MSGAKAELAAERPVVTRAWHRKLFGSKFLLISVAVHVLFGCLGLTWWCSGIKPTGS